MIYDETKTYAQNLEKGPIFKGPIPERELLDKKEWVDFLGLSLASPFGVPAGPLLDSRYIDFAAKLGFDLLSYKTIRSVPWPAHELPNIVFVEEDLDDQGSIACETKNKIALSLTNSFGMPSQDLNFLAKDLPLAKKVLKEGQALIVSVTGSPIKERSFYEDFVYTALFAKEHQADFIEANFSCPNVCSKQKAMYLDVDVVYELSKRLTKALGDTPLIIKVGIYPDIEQQRAVFHAAARAGVGAVCGINSKSYRVFGKDGSLALGAKRPSSGVCGAIIQKDALEFIKQGRKIIDQDGLDLKIIGVGGVMNPEDIDRFLDQGADCVQSAVAMMDNPLLARQYLLQKSKQVLYPVYME